MNVFYLDRDAAKAAQAQCNKHVVKMLLETAQLLSTTHHVMGSTAPYKKTHMNHPSAVWARQSSENYHWLYRHFKALSDEYTRRYGKIHLSWVKCRDALREPPEGISDAPFTDPPLCMPDECKRDDAVEAYRTYYNHKANQWAEQGSPMVWC